MNIIKEYWNMEFKFKPWELAIFYVITKALSDLIRFIF